ncbi:3-deoxy-manno-octulosonate cytidylyltransferase [Iodobacter fluviatilis]|uniref:3-deoxy-manno-octulosonate cytidylyltransferase n=1 Tax=Iodobacter fluviatilis TaxID=537 RepID=A0A377Q6I6_9NEIS|nr:3-deoxy-manno-octulosonate cytidylyltransferase [Iodobacter fluviatilis]TCU87036.1 3-deoxy-manno-octulosonate cytidylyltransferase (CMP-KDO synthetase) [Iodobacter fluviatilis]STQ90368.1 3-deoxy-manno-octulosonate cytidylyltransferase [Iodobacter fluviatilis]
MSFVALIPARLKSTRLPDKPLADIGGKPMIVRVIEQALKSSARLVCVATDDEQIKAAVEAAGYTAILTRSDHPSGTDRLAEAIEHLGLADDAVVVNVQGDEPLIDPLLIDAVAAKLIADRSLAMSTACHAISDRADFLNSNVVKVVLDAKQRAMYFSRAAIPWPRDAFMHDQAVLPAELTPLRHIGIYGYRAEFLRTYQKLSPSCIESIEALEQLRVLWHGYSIGVHISADAPLAGVDTPEDLARVRDAFARLSKI